tara:strand:- start:5743 stop:6309 length:567 start_codon:yes stop_codon:yes gene_type:complete
VEIDLLASSDTQKQNQAMNMLDHWLAMVVNDSIVVNLWHENQWPTTLGVLDNNIIVAPGEPDDFTLSMLFLTKMQSILGNSVTINSLEFVSDAGAGVSFTITPNSVDLPIVEEWMGAHRFYDKPWWLRSDGSTCDIPADHDQDITCKPNILINLPELIPSHVAMTNKQPAEIIALRFPLKVINRDDNT